MELDAPKIFQKLQKVWLLYAELFSSFREYLGRQLEKDVQGAEKLPIKAS